MMLPLKMTRDAFRLCQRMLDRASVPQCHRCGAAMRFLEMLDEPVYDQPGKALAQFLCDPCGILVEELRPI